MLKRYFTVALFVLASLGLWAHGAHAINTFFLYEAAIADFSEQDVDLMVKTFDRALETGRDGDTLEWANPRVGNGGSVTVLESLQRDQRDCRRMRIDNYSKNAKGQSEYLFCRIEDGTWKLVPQR